jgi:hypothetical protein
MESDSENAVFLEVKETSVPVLIFEFIQDQVTFDVLFFGANNDIVRLDEEGVVV